MPVILQVLFIASLLPILSAWVGGYYRVKQFGKFDNHYPRQQQAQLTGIGARAMGAQANSWEALMMFTVAVVIAIGTGLDLNTLTVPALVFLVARVGYIALYLADKATPRSLVFVVGAGACLWIVAKAAMQHAV